MPSQADDQPTGERIAKLLARAGIASRREVERMIAEGRIARDGVPLDTPATVLTSLAGITVDGQPVAAPAPARLFLYHKPPGLLVTERDPKGRTTIYDRLPDDLPRVVPVGRLDLNTEGLLLLTTDGGFKRQLELPSTGVERSYRARAYGHVTQAQLEELIEGVEIEGIRYGSINANIERRTGANVWIEMTLTEGKNREVRRVLEHLDLQVSRLIRVRYGPFILGDLPPGEVGEVRQADLVSFRKDLGRGRTGPGERANIGISTDAGAGMVVGTRRARAATSAPPAARPMARPLPRPVTSVAREDRPARPARPERIRPTAAMQRGDASAPWTKPALRGADRPERAADRPRSERDRGEPLTAKPKHFRAAKPPRDAALPPRPATAAAGDKRVQRTAGGRPGASQRTDRPAAPARPGKGPAGGRGHPPRTPRGKR